MINRISKGFTLIELLVAISIIGILATLITANLTRIQSRGRDAQRIETLNTIAAALELYYSEVGTYPTRTAFNLSSATQLVHPTNATIIYLDEIPQDPRDTGASSPFQYYYCAGNDAAVPRRTYNLYANLENDNDPRRFCGVSTATSWSDGSVTCDNANLASSCGISASNAAALDFTKKQP
jgi:general secretion pathway protein G